MKNKDIIIMTSYILISLLSLKYIFLKNNILGVLTQISISLSYLFYLMYNPKKLSKNNKNKLPEDRYWQEKLDKLNN